MGHPSHFRDPACKHTARLGSYAAFLPEGAKSRLQRTLPYAFARLRRAMMRPFEAMRCKLVQDWGSLLPGSSGSVAAGTAGFNSFSLKPVLSGLQGGCGGCF
eukprot:926318-Amphidinium_carterae.1